MKREFLKELGLTDEQIDKIMAENGKDIEKFKTELDVKEKELETKKKEIETLQGQLETANKEIESYKTMDIEGIKRAAEEYKVKFEQAQKKAKEEIEALKFEHSLENALNKAGAKNVKAAKALLDIEALKTSKNFDKDLEAVIAALKESDGYLFNDVEPTGTGGSIGNKSKVKSGMKNPWSQEHFNLTEQGRILREDPELAQSLMAQAKK